jgi:hypothetical protein
MQSVYSIVDKKKKPSSRMTLPPSNYATIQTNSARFDGSKYFVNGHEVFHLEREIIFCLNNKDPIKCHGTTQGTLCVFELPIHDVIYLNSLLYQLALLKDFKCGHVHYLRQSIDKINSAEHYHYDRSTRVFNRYGQELMKSDFIGVIQGRVALSIQGIRVIDGYHIYLEVTVSQVKIEEEEDVKMSASGDCIFD